MNIKNASLKITIAFIISLLGIVFLLDQLDIAFIGAMKHWYIWAILTFSAIFIAFAIVKKSYYCYLLAFGFAGLYLALHLTITFNNIGFYQTWPLFFIGLSLGSVFGYLMTKKYFIVLKFNLIILAISIPLLVGLLTDTWKIVLPCIIIASGLLYIIFSIIPNKKNKNIDEGDYVTPSKKD